MVGVHVDEAVFLDVRAGPEVLVRGADVAHVRTLEAGRPVQQTGRHHQVVEEPHVGPVTVGRVTDEPVMTAGEFQPHPLADRARTAVAKARRELTLPQVAGFHHVIVDGDDQREVFGARGGHEAAPFARWTYRWAFGWARTLPARGVDPACPA